jgi:hypothetical protein
MESWPASGRRPDGHMCEQSLAFKASLRLRELGTAGETPRAVNLF